MINRPNTTQQKQKKISSVYIENKHTLKQENISENDNFQKIKQVQPILTRVNSSSSQK